MNPSLPSPATESVSRRNFLKTSSAAAVGSGLLGGLTIERAAHAAGSDEIRIGLVGCGGRGTGAADHNLNTHGLGKVKIVAMGDVHQDQLTKSLQILQKKHGDRVEVSPEAQFVGFDAYKQVIPLCDVVILATPPGFRPIMFEEAVKQGKHVFMEKPVAVDGPGVRRVLEAAKIAKQNNLKVAVGLQRRHQPNYEQSIKRMQDGEIGQILAARVYWNGGPVGPKMRRADLEKRLGRPPTEMEYQLRNWYNFVWTCGDHIVEQHIHNLDVINWIKNAYPVSCHGLGGRAYLNQPDHGEIFDHHAVEYEYADGTLMFSQCRQIPGCNNDVAEAVTGSKGLWSSKKGTGYPEHSIRDFKGEVQWRYKAAADESNDGHQMEHFPLMKAIRENKDYNEAERGALSSLTAIMGRMATYSGKTVTWEQALNSKLDHAPEKFDLKANPRVMPNADGSYNYPIPGKTVAL